MCGKYAVSSKVSPNDNVVASGSARTQVFIIALEVINYPTLCFEMTCSISVSDKNVKSFKYRSTSASGNLIKN